jgi:hypothetical protein
MLIILIFLATISSYGWGWRSLGIVLRPLGFGQKESPQPIGSGILDIVVLSGLVSHAIMIHHVAAILVSPGQGWLQRLRSDLPAAIVKEHSISLTEIKRRMQFAEQFITKQEVLNAVEDFRSWRQIARKALPKTPRPTKPNTFEERMGYA